MRDPMSPTLAKWPFYVGDLLLLGAAYFVSSQSKLPMGPWQIVFVVLCVAGGAWLCVMPFLLEYRVQAKLAEAHSLTTVVAQIRNLDGIAQQISGATARWQTVQEQADKTATAAKTVADGMSHELKTFGEFMQRANDSEKATLRVEIEKLRRAESDWLQVVVRMLDHVYALHSGALRSGQPKLIEQLTQFQAACRDVARRIGLAPFTANPDEPFDAQRHQIVDGNEIPPAGATVAETVATGYTFQGRLLRPALVRLVESATDALAEVGPGPGDPVNLANG